MKALWSGYITLGHLGFPVRLFSGTKTGRQRFTQLHKQDLSPIELVQFCKAEQQKLSPDDIIKGVKQPDGSYLTLTDQELDQASGDRTKAIQIQQFCRLQEIDPVYYQKHYYIVPDTDGKRAYALVREVLARTQKVAVAQFILQGKEHIAAIRPYDSLLVLHQLRFTHELIPRSDIKTPPLQKPTIPELQAGNELVDKLSGPFFAEDFHDSQADVIQAMLKRKAKGLPAVKRQRSSPPPETDEDIVGAIRRSLDEPPASLPE